MTRSESDRTVETQRRPAMLVVCTANICRSPMVEAVLRSELGGRNWLGVLSAGTDAVDRPIDPRTLDQLRAWGIDEGFGRNLAAHRGRAVRSTWLQRADLVVTLERDQLRSVAVQEPTVLSRTFTMLELVQLTPSRLGVARPTGAQLRDWASAIGSRRSLSSLLRDPPGVDFPDPVGLDDAAFAREARWLRAAAVELAALLCLSGPGSGH